MVNIELIDTVKVSECGQQILNEASAYKEIIDNLYNKINNMTSKTFEWVGAGANQYVEKVNNDYKLYCDIHDILTEYGQFLIDVSSNIEDTIKRNT